MRLINAHTLQLEDFTQKKAPPYIILSHTWGNDEITFQALLRQKVNEQDPKWAKIVQTCRLAKEEKLDYAWIDTCCIDKSSSAELTESINSMYRWYEAAHTCVVSLFDLRDGKTFTSDLGKCRWTTRGWTMQEVIAPKVVKFYDANWKLCATKDKQAASIADHLGLPREVLEGSSPVGDYSVAQRMSWVGRRTTTRAEDIAYCLLGVFDVNMPLIYGEGAKAFRRLQQAIIAQKNDFTIFAWQSRDADAPTNAYRKFGPGLLAAEPAQFSKSAAIRPSRGDFAEFAVTNKGLLVRGDILLRVTKYNNGERYAMRVGRKGSLQTSTEVRIGLRRISPNMFCRDHFFDGQPETRSLAFFWIEEFYILESMPSVPMVGSLLLQFRSQSLHIPRVLDGFEVIDLRPRRLWDSQDRLFLRPRANEYPNILAMMFAGTSCPVGKHYASCIVLCDFRGDEPQLHIFSRGRNPHLLRLMFGESTRHNSIHWDELRHQLPDLKGHGATAAVRIHDQDVQASAELRVISLAMDEGPETVEVFSLGLRFEADSNGPPFPCGLVKAKPDKPSSFRSTNMGI